MILNILNILYEFDTILVFEQNAYFRSHMILSDQYLKQHDYNDLQPFF